VAIELTLRLFWEPPPEFGFFAIAPSFREPEPYTFEPIPGYAGRLLESLSPDLPPSATFRPRLLEIRINAQGLRGPVLPDKRPGERRIAFSGDSLTFGHLLDESESFPARTAALLDGEQAPVSACNGGVPGYGLVATYKRLLRLREPTAADVLVAAYFLGNDFLDDIQQLSCTVVAGRLYQGPVGNLVHDSWRGRLCAHSRLWLFLEIWLLDHAIDWSLMKELRFDPEQTRRQATLPHARTNAGLFLDAPVDHVFNPGQAPAVATWLADLENSLRNFKDGAAGLPVLFVVLPTRFHIDPALRAQLLGEMGLDPALLQLGSAQRHLTGLCKRLGIPCVDTTPLLAAVGDPASVYNVDRLHLNARGNAVVAEAIAGQLRPLLR
jgi:lysophospholipase L1-like esterase